MKDLVLKKKIWLALGIFSILSAVAGTPLLAWFAVSGWYFLTAVFVLLVAHGFYGIPFYFRAFARCGSYITVLDKYLLGITDASLISDDTSLTPQTVKLSLAYLKKKGYIT